MLMYSPLKIVKKSRFVIIFTKITKIFEKNFVILRFEKQEGED